MTCERCWAKAFTLSRMNGTHQADEYRKLLDTETHEDDDDGDVG